MKRFMLSLKHALNGLYIAYKEEKNFRVHVFFSLLVPLLAWVLGCSLLEWFILIITISIVLMAELFNTAIENTLDWLKPSYHLIVKRVKDLSAAAVLIVALMAILIGCLIFIPKLWSLFF